MECRWQVEIDQFCTKVLEKHWPGVKRYGDITKLHGDELERVDLLCGGFPCQDISYAGHGGGLDGNKSGLWWHFARIIRALGPTIVIVENVAALLTRGIGEVLGTFSDLGYDAEWSVVSACSMGATHMRRRLFIVAYAHSVDGRQRVWDQPQREQWTVSSFDSFESSRARQRARMENPSELYGGADDVADGLDRNHAIGNCVYPDCAEWIGRRIMERLQ